MQIYWSELTITIGSRTAVTGNAARDEVQTQLGLTVGGDGSTSVAVVTWKGREVSGDLLRVVLPKVAKDAGTTCAVDFRKDDGIDPREGDVFAKYDLAGDAERERLNTLRRKHHPYVIVGCGAAAIVNHTTLRQTKWGKDRVGVSKIIHIGFEDPWSHYNEHEMGQFPQLLGLPGYRQRPKIGGLDGEDTTQPYKSNKFGANTGKEVERLGEHGKTKGDDLEMHRYCVALIQPRGVAVQQSVITSLVKEGLDLDEIMERLNDEHPDHFGRYRLLLVNREGKLGWGYARYVDICTGAGKPRAADVAMVGQATYDAMRTRIWQPVEWWNEDMKKRLILTGTEALYQETDWSGTDKRYAIMGSGGVAVNMIERVRDTEKWADWLATGTLHASFPIGRNDILLRHPHTWNDLGTAITREGARMEMNDLGAGRKNQVVPMDPASKKWRFGQGSDVRRAAVTGQQVEVTFAGSTRNNTYEKVPNNPEKKDTPIASSIRDYWEKDSPLTAGSFPFSDAAQTAESKYREWRDTPGRYDRLIRASGQDIRDVGQAEKLAAHLTLQPITAPSDGRMVGLQTPDGSVRVLGAAGTGNEAIVPSPKKGAHKVMTDYHDTLPAQGQIMLVGFVFSSLNVAVANHYFDPANKRATTEGGEPTADVAPNTNVNTMSREELATFLGDPGIAREIATARLGTQEGFKTKAEILRAVLAARYGDALPDGAPEMLKLEGDWEGLLDRSITNLGFIDHYKPTADPVAGPLLNRVIAARRKHGKVLNEPDRTPLKGMIRDQIAADALLKEKVELLETQYRPADPYVF